MKIEQALREHEERVDALIKAVNKCLTILKAWKKACQLGHVGNRQKAAAAAVEQVSQLQQLAQETAALWDFDTRAYLESDAWRVELQEACSKLSLRIFEEEDRLVSPPVLVRAEPVSSRLRIGKTPWPTLHPDVTTAHLKRLNERSTSDTAAQLFLNFLYEGSKSVSRQGNQFARLKDLYDLFSYAPGWAKENTPAIFARQIYALHRSGVRTTKDGRTYELEGPTGKEKEKERFPVISDDGRPIIYYGIWFR